MAFSMELVSKFWRDDLIFFDVGSYEGDDARLCKRHFPHSSVVSIEANKFNFDTRMSDLSDMDIYALNIAVSDYDGIIEFAPSLEVLSSHSGAGTIYIDGCDHHEHDVLVYGDVIKVPCKRLDTICNELNLERIDILTIDIEGAEPLAYTSLGILRPKAIFAETRIQAGKDKTIPFWRGAKSVAEAEEQLFSMGYYIDSVHWWNNGGGFDTLYFIKE